MVTQTTPESPAPETITNQYDVGCNESCHDCVRRTPCLPCTIGGVCWEASLWLGGLGAKWEREKIVNSNPTTMMCTNMSFILRYVEDSIGFDRYD